tara:strand:- start:1544 stop:2029 length:486 start_codon:yes stop_codon:yes gene_type:complete
MKKRSERSIRKVLIRFISEKKSPLFFSFVSCFLLLNFASCSSEKGNPERFKTGVFEIPAGNGYGATRITRIDSFQIEEYDKIISISNDSIVGEKKIKQIDTLYIEWKNNFFYSLKMKSPKKELDRDILYVQITKITKNSYDFSVKIGFSKYLTEGTLTKIE